MNDNVKQPDPEDAPDQESAADDPREALKQGLDKTRLPPALKAQILAELPPPEEREQMYRESIPNGGLSFEELCASPGNVRSRFSSGEDYWPLSEQQRNAVGSRG